MNFLNKIYILGYDINFVDRASDLISSRSVYDQEKQEGHSQDVVVVLRQ